MYRHTGRLRTGARLRALATSSLEMFTELSTAILAKKCYLLVIPKYLNNDFIAFAHSKSHPYLTDKPYFHKTTLKLKLIERILNYPFLSVMIAFSVILSILTLNTFSLFTLFFVLFPLNLHIARNNAALHLIFTQQLSMSICQQNVCPKLARINVSKTNQSSYSDSVVFFGLPCTFVVV